MATVKYINADVATAVQNVMRDENNPAYFLFDENWIEIGRCKKFSAVGGKLVFERSNGRSRVYLELANPSTLATDHEVVDSLVTPHIARPSSRGMYSKPAKPIWVDGVAFKEVWTYDMLIGHYERSADVHPFWVEFETFAGETA